MAHSSITIARRVMTEAKALSEQMTAQNASGEPKLIIL